ncbi:MAG: 50S ribosomal protein L19 [Patescibacteria group bacterium]|nr:50S ribosomal protein L19 [Patescibacteria group bacterium]
MNQKIIDFNKSQQKNKVPTLRVGDIVRVHKRIQEGDKERIQIFKGLIIAIKGKQSSSPTITVRRESGKVGVEATFPIHLPTIEKIDLLRHSKVRRSKIYYMRERSGRGAKMKAVDITEDEKKFAEEVKKETKTENKKPAKKNGMEEVKKEEKKK